MKKLVVFLITVGLLMAGSGMALATGFYGITNQLGYEGTVWNKTDDTGPWTTSTPRDAYLYTVVNYPGMSNYNYLLSNWSEHAVSNQNNSFFQLAEDGNPSVTSANGFWSADLKTFEMTVTGANAPYPWSRFWQPDTVNGVAWGVTFTDYSYTFTATFLTAASLDLNGFYVNSSPADTIAGIFLGEFVVTYDVNKNLIQNGDTYGFNIALSQAMLDPLDSISGYDGTAVVPYSEFGSTQVVPLPGALVLLGGGLVRLAAYSRRKKALA